MSTIKNNEQIMLPAIVYQMCVHGALIAGSLAKKLAGENIETHDYDLLVPHDKWPVIALLIPLDAKPNKFGGWRWKINDDKEVDVWPSTMQEYLSNCKTKHGGKVCLVDFINNKLYSSETIPI